MRHVVLALAAVASLSACATIVNDPEVPVALSFSDGSAGSCTLTNTRATYDQPHLSGPV